MTVLNGSLILSPIGRSNSPALAGSLSGYAIDAVDHASMTQLQGGLVSNYPVSATPVVLTGSVSPGFGTDFFRHYLVHPTRLDAGFVNGDLTLEVKLWNRNPYSVTVTSILASNASGVTLALNVGATFASYQERTLAVGISSDGPGIISATFRVMFSDGEYAEIVVVGTRARARLLQPNWKDPYTTYEAFKTETVVSRSGREQRRALRHKPRFSSEFSVLLYDGELARFDNVMGGWQNKPFVTPDYTDSSALVTGVAATDESISVSDDIFSVGNMLVITDGTNSGIHAVTTKVGSTLTVSPAIDRTWPAGTTIYRGYSGYFSDSIQVTLETNEVGTSKLRFDAVPTPEPETEPPAAVDTWNGRELFLKTPNWGYRPTVDFEWPVESVDYGRGSARFFRIIEFSKQVVKSKFTCRDRAAVREIRQFFYRMRGMRGEFYAPTWKPDMELAASITGGGNVMTVKGGTTYNVDKDSTTHRSFVIVMNDGTRHFNTVSSMALVGDNTQITCAHNWPAINAADVLMVCWMPVWTLASDILTVSWLTDTIAQIDLAMRTVEDL